MSSLFISPHPDDIAYSCLIPAIRNKGYKHVLTVFGQSKYAFGTSNNNIELVTRIRMQEDLNFAHYINADLSYFHFPDSSITYMPNKSIEEIYVNRNEIENCIISIYKLYNFTDVYFPAALCWHYDHLLIHDIVLKTILPLASSNVLFHMYEDYPYIVDMTAEEIKKSIFKAINSLKLNVSFDEYFEKACQIKQECAINIYTSQKDELEIKNIFSKKFVGNYVREVIWNLETIR